MIGPSDSPRIVPAEGTYYHIAKIEPLDPVDFRSQEQQNRTPRPRRPNEDVTSYETYRRQWKGVSVHDTLEQSRRHAEYFKWRIGDLIVELVIPEGTEITYERVGEDGHGVLYNTVPETLVAYATKIFRPRTSAMGQAE